MKIFLLLLLSFILKDISAQVTYDPNVAKEFDSVYEKLSPEYQKATKFLDPGSLIVCTALIDDTLNLGNLRPKNVTIRIYDTTGKLAEDVDESMPSPFPMMIFHFLKGDTLNIEVTPWIMSNQTIRHKIRGKFVSTTYEEYYKQDNILRAKEGAPITNDLIIPATAVKFVLSDKIFKEGKTIYGQADIITKDFLFEAAPDFKYNIMKHRFHFKYYFKIKLMKSQVAGIK